MICGVIGDPVGGGVALATLPPSNAAPTATAAIRARPYHFDVMNLPFGSVQGSPRRPDVRRGANRGGARMRRPGTFVGCRPLNVARSECEVPGVDIAGVHRVDVLHLEL